MGALAARAWLPDYRVARARTQHRDDALIRDHGPHNAVVHSPTEELALRRFSAAMRAAVGEADRLQAITALGEWYAQRTQDAA
jgi:hypothetical protein